MQQTAEIDSATANKTLGGFPMDSSNAKKNDELLVLKLNAQRLDYVRDLAYTQERLDKIEQELEKRRCSYD